MLLQMDSFKLAVKFYLADGSTFDLPAVVPVFHSWIQTRGLERHQLIDVADYDHVPNGPGVVLVSYEANLATDSSDGRPGLLYFRKQPIEAADTFARRLRGVFHSTLQACQKLEEASFERGPLRFRTDNPSFRIHDRLLAPNEPETFEAVRGELAEFLKGLYGGPVTLEHPDAPDRLFEARVTAPNSPAVADLLKRLES